MIIGCDIQYIVICHLGTVRYENESEKFLTFVSKKNCTLAEK